MSSKPHIVLVIPRGEVVRNFLYSSTIDILSKNAKVTLLSVVYDEDFKGRFADRCEAILPLQEYAEHRIVGILRDGLDIAHGRWLWSEVAKNRWQLRDWEARRQSGLLPKFKRTAKKVMWTPFANRTGVCFLAQIERAASRMVRPTDAFIQLFRDIKPDLVFNGSHVHSKPAIQPVQAAIELRIPTATFIFSWDNLTSQGRIMLPYRHYLVWHERMRGQLLDIYRGIIGSDQVTITGTPQFDFHFNPEYQWSREAFCDRMGLNPTRPIILYTTSMPDHFPQEPLHVESIIEILKEYPESTRPQLLLRVYAKDRQGTFDSVRAKYCNSTDVVFPHTRWKQEWLTPEYEDLYDYTNMISHANLGINGASTVSLELLMHDKPVINIGYNPPGSELPYVLRWARHLEFDHYCPVAESGAVMVARSEDDMRSMIHCGLDQPSAGAAKRKEFITRFFGDKLDGHAGDRVAAKLLDIARKATAV